MNRRLIIAMAMLLPLIAACSGPSGSKQDSTAVSSPAPTSARSTAITDPGVAQLAAATPQVITTPVRPEIATPSPGQPPHPTASATPSPTKPVESTATVASEPEQAATSDNSQPAVWLPEERPEDQQVELLDLDLHYALHVSELSASTGFVRVSETVTIREFRGYRPREIFFQVPAAGYGFFTLDEITLNGSPIEPGSLNGGSTLVLNLPENIATPVEVGINFQLNIGGPEPSGWGYMAVDADVLRLGYWFPMISDDHPFSLTLDPSYTRVATFDMTLDIDAGLAFSHSGEIAGSEQLADGRIRYLLHGENIRDFDLVLSPGYTVDSIVSQSGVRIEYARRSGVPQSVSSQVLATTADAIDSMSNLVGPYPWPTLRIADAGPSMPGGIEYGNHIWINPTYSQLDRLIYHEVAHMWLYGIIGTRTLEEGWIDEGGAEFFERGLPSNFSELAPVPSGGYCCPLDARWEELPQSGNGTYFAIYEQGQRFYMAVLETMGWDDFWSAMQQVYATYALDIVTAFDMLRIWQANSSVDLRPLFNNTFRYPWIDDLPPPGVTSQQGWLALP